MTGWILSSSILIAVVMGLRYLLKGKIAPGLQYTLWLLVLLRLLIPGEFTSSAISVQNLLSGSETAPAYDVTYQEYELTQRTTTYSYFIPEYTPVTAEPELISTSSAMFNWPQALTVVWVTGIVLVLSVLLVSNLHFYRKLRRSRTDYPSKLSLRVYTAEELPSPCLFGFPYPAIYLPSHQTTGSQAVSHILAHEMSHYRHGDHLWSLLRGIVLAFHWYNPLVWAAAVLSKQDAELACDAAAIRRLGEDHRIPYGRTLLQLITAKPRPADLFSCATTMTTGKKSLTQRITYICKQPKMLAVTLVCVFLVSVIAVGCTFTGAETPEAAENEPLSAIESGQVTLFHQNLDTIVLRGGEAAEQLTDLYNSQQITETSQPMDNLHRITVTFENGVFWSVTPSGVCSSSERMGNYLWENCDYNAVADIFWETLSLDSVSVTDGTSIGLLSTETAASWIETFRTLALTPTSNEPDSEALTFRLYLDSKGLSLFTIDRKGEVVLSDNSGGTHYYMCAQGEELYQALLWDSNIAGPSLSDVCFYNTAANTLTFTGGEFSGQWTLEVTGRQSNGEPYYRRLTDPAEVPLGDTTLCSVTATCTDPSSSDYCNLMVMAFPEYSSSPELLSEEACTELLRKQLIQAYELRFGLAFEPLEEKPENEADDQNNLRYWITTLKPTRYLDELILYHMVWDTMVDRTTGDIYVYYHGLDPTFTKFDPTNPNALYFAG